MRVSCRYERAGPGESGFTLIELVVVVAIIALLVGILLPSLKSARRQARVVACLANAKAIATASLTYATADRGEQAVPIHRLTGVVLSDIGAYDWGGKSGVGEPTLGADQTSSIWGTQDGRGPATRPLNEVVFKSRMVDYVDDPGPNQANWIGDYGMDLALYRCPSDRGFTGHHFPAFAASGLSSYDHYGTSYVANTYWGSMGVDIGLGGTAPCMRSLTLIPSAANTYYHIENAGRFAWSINMQEEYADDDHYYGTGHLQLAEPGIARGWHGRPYYFVASFVDGHASLIHMNGRNPPPPPMSSQQYPTIYLETHITRGTGWQKDTFPGPIVATNIPLELNLITNIQ